MKHQSARLANNTTVNKGTVNNTFFSYFATIDKAAVVAVYMN
jgi:hypothetical protein